jgi:cytochrome c553
MKTRAKFDVLATGFAMAFAAGGCSSSGQGPSSGPSPSAVPCPLAAMGGSASGTSMAFGPFGVTSGTTAASGTLAGTTSNNPGPSFPPSGPISPCGSFVDPGLLPVFGTTVTASTTPPPISGGTLMVLRDGVTAVASDPDRDAVYIVNSQSGTVTHTISLQQGDEPGRLVEDGGGRVQVALRSGGALVTIDPVLGTVTARRSVCPAPRGLAWDSTTDSVWVACATGELVALPAAGGAATTRWTVERDLRDVIVSNGSLTVTEFRSAQVLRLGAAGAIARRDVMAQDGTFVPHVAWRAVVGPSQSVVVAHQGHSTQNIQTIVPGGYGTNGPGAIEAECTMMAPDGTIVASFALNSLVLPVDVAVSPDESFAAIVGAGNSFAPELSQLAIVQLATTVGGSAASSVPVPPLTPVGVADTAALVDADAFAPEPPVSPGPPSGVTPPSTTLQLARGEQAIAIAFDGSGHVLVQTREPAHLWVIPIQTGGASPGPWPPPTSAPIVLSSATRDDTGHDIFHTSAGALIACASCHPEGGDDGHVWTLNGQARRTPSLRGTIEGTAPYHWPGDEPDLPTLTSDVYTSRMSGQQLEAGQMTALATWIQKVPAPPAPSWVDPAAAARGAALFSRADVGCSRCHSGAKFTNNQTLDVGTGQAFQVPPLVGVGWRTPLFHDGCAQTIADRFGACSTPAHGNISTLTTQNISDMTAYLQTL